MNPIEVGSMVFLAEGKEGIGAVREVRSDGFVLYVENAGEFEVPLSAVSNVHDSKVLINPQSVGPALLDAVRHAHDAEDPKLVG